MAKYVFSHRCYDEVEADPTKSIGRIYLDVRTELSRDFDQDDKDSFFRMIPSQRVIEPALYQFRRNFIPRKPTNFVRFHHSMFEKFFFLQELETEIVPPSVNSTNSGDSLTQLKV